MPNLATGAQPSVRIAQANNTLPFVSVYAARANGYFDEEGVPVEFIIVQGGTDIAALIGGSVDFDATSTGGLLRAFSGGIDLLGVHNILGSVSSTWLFEKTRRSGWVSLLPCPS